MENKKWFDSKEEAEAFLDERRNEAILRNTGDKLSAANVTPLGRSILIKITNRALYEGANPTKL
jgi:viroplasmin and RNaseH domain-containing protein